MTVTYAALRQITNESVRNTVTIRRARANIDRALNIVIERVAAGAPYALLAELKRIMDLNETTVRMYMRVLSDAGVVNVQQVFSAPSKYKNGYTPVANAKELLAQLLPPLGYRANADRSAMQRQRYAMKKTLLSLAANEAATDPEHDLFADGDKDVPEVERPQTEVVRRVPRHFELHRLFFSPPAVN